MRKRLQFSDEFFRNQYIVYSGLKTNKEKGAFRDGLIANTPGLTKDIWYRGIKKFKEGQSVKTRSDRGKPRVANEEQLMQDVKVVAAIKYGHATSESGKMFKKGVFETTGYAIELAMERGLISKKYSVSTINYYLRKFELNAEGMKRDRATVHLSADFTYQWMQLDASPAISIYLDSKAKTKKIIYDTTFKADTSHGRDRLERLGLKRIWGYHMVDVYSKAFDVIFFADAGLGENADDLLTAMIYFSSRKRNKHNPLYGLPLNIYSDPGSGFRSNAFRNFNFYFGIEHKMHEPGRANSTGAVESRIKYNQKFERRFGFQIKRYMSQEDRFEAFKNFMEQEVINYNYEKKFYSKWEEGLQNEPILPQRQDFVNARVEPIIATVDGFGEVTLDRKKYYVSPDLKGKKVTLMRRYCNLPVAIDKDKTEYICQNKREVTLGETYYGNVKTDWERNREEVKTLAGQIRRKLSMGGVVLQKNITSEDVFFTLCEDLGIGASEIPDDMQREALLFFESCLERNGEISEENKDSIQKIFYSYLQRSGVYEKTGS